MTEWEQYASLHELFQNILLLEAVLFNQKLALEQAWEWYNVCSTNLNMKRYQLLEELNLDPDEFFKVQNQLELQFDNIFEPSAVADTKPFEIQYREELEPSRLGARDIGKSQWIERHSCRYGIRTHTRSGKNQWNGNPRSWKLDRRRRKQYRNNQHVCRQSVSDPHDRRYAEWYSDTHWYAEFNIYNEWNFYDKSTPKPKNIKIDSDFDIDKEHNQHEHFKLIDELHSRLIELIELQTKIESSAGL